MPRIVTLGINVIQALGEKQMVPTMGSVNGVTGFKKRHCSDDGAFLPHADMHRPVRKTLAVEI